MDTVSCRTGPASCPLEPMARRAAGVHSLTVWPGWSTPYVGVSTTPRVFCLTGRAREGAEDTHYLASMVRVGTEAERAVEFCWADPSGRTPAAAGRTEGARG